VASDTVLQLHGIGLAKSGKRLLEDISFGLERGKFHALLGPNGAGKSSLMKILYRVERAGTGEVMLDGKPLTNWPRTAYAARVGALVQEAVTLSGLSLGEVVRLGMLPLRLSAGEMNDRCGEALELVGLADRIADDAAYLSGGEQQRLFFAQLLALDPDIYLLDEPHNHLDLHYQYVLLNAVKARGKTVLASFHDLTLATRYCDQAFLLNHGRLAAQGALAEVLTTERMAEVYRVDARYSEGIVRIEGALAQSNAN